MEKPISDVLRRKLRTEDRSNPQEQAVTPAKALRLGLARAADQAFQLALRVQGIRQGRLLLTETLERIPDGWALFPLVHDDGSVGAFCVNPANVIAFVEQQTSGRVCATTPSQRALTRTDKALSQPLVEVFLTLFDDTLKDAPTAFWTRGYRCEDAADTRHLLALHLEAAEYRSFDIATQIVGSERAGEMRMVLPIKDADNPGKPRPVSQSQQKGASLRPAALAASVALNAVMCRITLPLGELDKLDVGQVLQLPHNVMQKTRLEDATGRTSLPVHLGQLHGMRAVRVVAKPVLPDSASDAGQATAETGAQLATGAQVTPSKQSDNANALLVAGAT